MLRKTVIALLAVASIGLLAPDVASARGGGGGGGGGGGHGGGGFGGGHGGFGGGFHGGGFHGGGFHGGGFRGRGFGGFGLGLGYGLYDSYGDYGYPYYAYGDYPYGYDDSYYNDGGCYVVRRRVHTPSGWRIRPVQVCG